MKLVEENAKKRFEVAWGYDPSPPKPVKKKGQASKKSKPKQAEKDAAGVDDLRKEMEQALTVSVEQQPAEAEGKDEWQELPLVIVDRSTEPGSTETEASSSSIQGEWFIRASQGHSLKLEGTAHLTPVEDNEEGRERVGLMVHGTRDDLWDVIRESHVICIWVMGAEWSTGETGLSKMDRQHIHLAPAIENHRITPRPSSRLYIYLDLKRVLDAGIQVYTSANGVVLSPGDEQGRIQKELWSKVERKVRGERVLIWQDGKDVEPPVPATTST